MTDWKLFLRTWKSQTSYRLGMYLVYENLMSLEQGPALLQKYATILRAAGFANTAPDTDIGCIWFNSIGKEKLEQYRQFGYEYPDYVPGYTKDQRDFIMSELKALISEYADDKELCSVLRMYYHDTKDNTPLDSKSVQSTMLIV